MKVSKINELSKTNTNERITKGRDTVNTMSSLSRSESLNDPKLLEIISISKTVLEKLVLYVNKQTEYIEKSNKNLYLAAKPIKAEKICQFYECLNIAKWLLGQCQAGLTDANLLFYTAELVNQLSIDMTAVHSEVEQYSKKNKILKKDYGRLVVRLIEVGGNLAKTKEENKLVKALLKIRLLDAEEEMDKLEAEIWKGTLGLHRKILIFSPEMENVLEIINECHLKEAYEKVKVYTSIKEKILCHDEEWVICLLAKRFCEENDNKTALEIIELIISSRKKQPIENQSLVANTLLAKAIIYAKRHQSQNALNCVVDAMKVIGSPDKNENLAIEFGQLYLTSGFFLQKLHFPEKGIDMMIVALQVFEKLLPSAEELWMDTIVKIARTCNDFAFHKRTLTMCSDLIDYFHICVYGPCSETNRTIIEAAFDIEEADGFKSIAIYSPKPVCVPPLLVAVLREIVIAFSAQYQFKAATLAEKYLKECLKLNGSNFINSPLTQEDESSKNVLVNVISRREARQNRNSSQMGNPRLKSLKKFSSLEK